MENVSSEVIDSATYSNHHAVPPQVPGNRTTQHELKSINLWAKYIYRYNPLSFSLSLLSAVIQK